jgi:hypothetical protein
LPNNVPVPRQEPSLQSKAVISEELMAADLLYKGLCH